MDLLRSCCSYSDIDGAEIAFSFIGDAIAVYGGVSFDHGDYIVSVDSMTTQLNGANGQARLYHPQVRPSQLIGSEPDIFANT